MTILFVSNEAQDFVSSREGIVNDTTAGTFDPNYVDSSIRVSQGSSATAFFGTGYGNELWIHFRAKPNATLDTNHDGSWFRVLGNDQNFTDIIRLDLSNGTTALTLAGSGGTTSTPFTSQTQVNAIQDYDINLTLNAGTFTATWYIDNLVVGTVSRAAGTFGMPEYIQLLPDNSTDFFFSEILVSTHITQFRRVGMIRPASQGNYNQWTGGFTQLNTRDMTSAITQTTDQRESSVLANYTGPTERPIEGVYVGGIAAKNGTVGPQQLRHFLRMSNTDYDGGLTVLNDIPTITGNMWEINPATMLPWTHADFAGTEIGLHSVT